MADLGTITAASSIEDNFTPLVIDSYTASSMSQSYGAIGVASPIVFNTLAIDTYSLGGTAQPYNPPSTGQLYPYAISPMS